MIAKIREGGHLEEGERGHCLVARRRGLSSSEEVAKESTLTYNAVRHMAVASEALKWQSL